MRADTSTVLFTMVSPESGTVTVTENSMTAEWMDKWSKTENGPGKKGTNWRDIEEVDIKLGDGLDVGAERKEGGSDDSQVSGFINWVDGCAIYETGQ